MFDNRFQPKSNVMMDNAVSKIGRENLTVFGATNYKANGTLWLVGSIVDSLHHIIEVAFYIKSKPDAVVCPRLVYATI